MQEKQENIQRAEFDGFEKKCDIQHAVLNNRLDGIGQKLQELIDKPMDFTVKVINGTTHERLASELIGEMYVKINRLEQNSWSKMLNKKLDFFVKIAAVASSAIAIYMIIK